MMEYANVDFVIWKETVTKMYTEAATDWGKYEMCQPINRPGQTYLLTDRDLLNPVTTRNGVTTISVTEY